LSVVTRGAAGQVIAPAAGQLDAIENVADDPIESLNPEFRRQLAARTSWSSPLFRCEHPSDQWPSVSSPPGTPRHTTSPSSVPKLRNQPIVPS
jgi:hypothetical protein